MACGGAFPVAEAASGVSEPTTESAATTITQENEDQTKSELIQTPSPLGFESCKVADIRNCVVPPQMNAKPVLELAKSYVEYMQMGDLTENSDVGIIVEAVNDTCNGQPCVAEVYFTAKTILLSDSARPLVRDPWAGTYFTVDTTCNILKAAEEREYFNWRKDWDGNSVLLLALDNGLAVLGENWDDTFYPDGGGRLDLEKNSFWVEIDRLKTTCP